MDINWGMGGPRDNALSYFQFGNQLGSQLRERQQEGRTREAIGKIFSQTGGQTPGIGDGQRDPGTEGAWNELAMADPRLAFQLRQQQQQHQQKQQDQRRADLPIIGRLLDHARDETTYQQARSAAQQYGIDAAQLPPNYDPAWVEQQRVTIKALQDPTKQEALSSAGKAAMDMGYKPGTAEFNQAVRDIWAAGESKPYVVGGETRLYTPEIAAPQQQAAPQGRGAPPTGGSYSVEQYRGLLSGLGSPEEAASFLARHNIAVSVATPQEARTLPRGTRIILPDGSEGRVP